MAEFDPPDDESFPGYDHEESDDAPVEEGIRYSGSSREDPSADLSTADLEEAYLKALEAMESAEWAIPADAGDDSADAESGPARVVADGGPSAIAIPETTTGTEIAGSNFLGTDAASDPAHPPIGDVSVQADSSTLSEAKTVANSGAASHIKPARIIEACLFVGGQPLSAKKLANLLEGNNDPADIEVLIDELNFEYAAQGRPYEIRLGDGGYRLTLRTEFDAVRSRVYGVGPRDIKLSQDVLEVLALVAYQQPIAHAAIEACKPNSANTLRQLLRRELISLTRIDQSRNGVEYRTTPRFLQLFGLGQLSELPRPEDLSIR